MKIYESAEILGTLKLRKGVADRVLTDGGFYSNQFGEIAYKSDIAVSSPDSSVFYGITVKPSNALYSKRNTSVVSFADEFYITQNAPNTDEIVVSLASDGVTVLNRERTDLCVANSTNALRVADVVIPANALGTEGCARGWIFGQFQSSANRIIQLVVALNGVTIFQDNSGSHTGHAQAKQWQIEWIFAQRQSTTLAFFQGMMLVGSVAPAGATGFGEMIGGITHCPIFGNTSVTDDSTVNQRLTFDMNFTTAAAGVDFYRHFAYSELLA